MFEESGGQQRKENLPSDCGETDHPAGEGRCAPNAQLRRKPVKRKKENRRRSL